MQSARRFRRPPGYAMTQLTLDLPFRPAWEREHFLISESNQDAVAWIDAWPDWSDCCLALIGPKSSGKSHLAAVWQARSKAMSLTAGKLGEPQYLTELAAGGAVLAEDIDRLLALAEDSHSLEESLLHLINVVKQRGGSLLLTGSQAPARLDIALPDLSSRLRAMQVARLGKPDDILLAALLEKHFSDRQVAVPQQVVRYLVQRIERSALAAHDIAERLDQEALAQGRPITLPLAKSLLDDA